MKLLLVFGSALNPLPVPQAITLALEKVGQMIVCPEHSFPSKLT
jgi:hypothetical protein